MIVTIDEVCRVNFSIMHNIPPIGVGQLVRLDPAQVVRRLLGLEPYCLIGTNINAASLL